MNHRPNCFALLEDFDERDCSCTFTTVELAEMLREDVAEGGWHFKTMLAAADRLAELDAEVAQLRAEGAELVAELFTPPESAVRYGDTIYVDQPSALMARLNDLYQKARDQKLGLDALTIIEARDAVEMYAIIDALRPPCPTCRGERKIRHKPELNIEHFDVACPDCVDGKVSIERLVARWNAVQQIQPADCPNNLQDTLDHLRGVKP